MKSIRMQMLVYLMLGAVVVFSALGFFAYERLNGMPQQIEKEYREIAKARADEVSKELTGFIDQIKIVSQSPIIKTMDINYIKEYLPNLVLEGKHKNMTVAKKDGKALRTTGVEIDISNQEQYEKIFVEKQDYYISQPFISPYLDENTPITTISHAVKNNGETIGLVNIVVEVEFLNRIVRGIDLKETGYGWIVNEEGMIVAHPDSKIPLRKNIRDFIAGDNNDLEKVLKDETGTIKYKDKNGQNMLALFKKIKDSPGWTFIISISEREVYSEVVGVRNAIIYAIIFGLILIVIFSFVYSKSISTPILKLKEVFEKAANGQLQVRADERIQNEVGSAAKSFNQMLNQIKNLTYRDIITGLYNYNGFSIEAPYKLKELEKKEGKSFLAVISIDDFKKINSIGSYELGNEVLKELANQFLKDIRKEECLGRFFGDEFILLLWEKDIKAAEDRIYDLWKKSTGERTVREHEFILKTSIGVSVFDSSKASIEEVIHQATIAKLKVKKTGGNSYQFYNLDINESIKEEQRIEHNLYNALDHDGLNLVYQPIVDVANGKILAVEALLRWNNERYGNVSAMTLIAIAEQSGLINAIGKWVLYTACKQNIAWQKNGYEPFVVSVNVSPLQFEQSNFIEMVQEILMETGLAPEYLELEITESNAMNNVEEKLKKMRELKKMGVRIAIDDFGTGYSSLAYITRFPIDTLKIDRSFITDILYDDNAKTIVTTIINMAKSIRLRTTAEGVETQEQFEYLHQNGCDKIQGYLISKPINAESIEDWLKLRENYQNTEG
ncbi:bifunctional diguanylate cyclase/phosphodiesterase [Desnuesiella massiliensis]|uniref:bifunctional diguanylate cyclase/phosphodiesterase n=1 Tax=Desnuesiella massiliensis TaxID=1650662 RepID=UPI0006E18BE1|nr:EAL domain-containing protein [Desnuesiella massiliensis]